MMPIFRPRDKVDIVAHNKATFGEVIERLQAGATVKIFPEGNHDAPHRLRPLKKGFARMAFWTAEAVDFETNLHIVPIGIYYSEPQKVGTDVLVQYGAPIPISNYREQYETHKTRAIKLLTQDLAAAMKPLMIHIENEKYYEAIEVLRKLARKKTQEIHEYEGDILVQNFQADKHIIAECERMIRADEVAFEALANDTMTYKSDIESYDLSDELFEKERYEVGEILLKIMGLVLALPLYIYAIIHSVLPYLILKYRFLSRVNDPIFYSTIAFTGGLFLFPIAWIIQSIPIGYFFGIWSALIYVFTMPFILKIGLWLHRNWQIVRAQYRYNYLSKNPDIQALKHLRKSILERIFN